jgi:hypothetical protein
MLRLLPELGHVVPSMNSRDNTNWTPLHYAMYNASSAECTRLLINAGAAVDARSDAGMTPLELSISVCQSELQHGYASVSERRRNLYSVVLRAGAALPAESDDAYLRKVIAAGGFRAYERNHLNALAATFLPKLPSLPPELVRRLVEYAFHVGDY